MGVEPSDELKTSDLKLNFLTHEARSAIKALDLGDLKIYDQVRLMVWCFNYSSKSIFRTLQTVRRANKEAVGRFIMDEAAKHAYRSFGSKRTHPEFGIEYRQAKFSAKAVRHLYYVDRTMICADYGNTLVRLDDFAELLNEIEYEVLLDLAADIGKRSIGYIFMRMEEAVAKRRKGREQIRQMSEVRPDYGEPMSEEDRQDLRKVLDEIRLVQSKDEGA